MAQDDNVQLAKITESLQRMPWLKQVILLVGLAASIAIGVGVAIWSQQEDLSPIAAQMNQADNSEAMAKLQGAGISAKINPSTGALMVPTDKLQLARMKLAEVGLPKDTPTGYGLLDAETGFGTSQFMETARYKRSLEGELAKTISSLTNVKKARVMLAIPKQSVFVRNRQKASASVFIDLYGGRSLNDSQVSAIVYLVSSSVPNMDSKQVAVVNEAGQLLTSNDNTGEFGASSKQFKQERKLEQIYANRIEDILSPLVGVGKVKAQVSVELDFTNSQQTQETFNPNSKVIVSEHTLVEKNSSGSGASGIPGALSNQPPEGGELLANDAVATDSGSTGGSPASTRQQSTKNYDIDRTISHIKRSPGQIQRITVAVVVDDKMKTSDSGTEEAVPYSTKDMEKMTQLVRDAVGFDASRGDSVNVINTPFVKLAEEPVTESTPIWKENWFIQLMKQVLAGIFILFLIIFVLRHILRSLFGDTRPVTSTTAIAAPGAGKVQQIQTTVEGQTLPAITDIGEGLEDKSIDEALLMLDDDNEEKRIEALRSIVKEDSKAVAQVVKAWLAAVPG